MRVLAVGLGLALSTGVVSAQPAPATPGDSAAPARKAKPRKKPAPARPADTRPVDAPQAPAATPAQPTAPLPAAPSPAAPSPAPARPGDARPSGSTPARSPDGKPAPTRTDEKAGANETLQKDNKEHPWVAGVSPAQRQAATSSFREGNTLLNDGLFVNAVEKYREALKHWNHPAIHYNLALALLNLDQPIEVHQHLNEAIQYGAEPLEKDKYEHAKEYLLLVEKQLADIEVSCDKTGAKVSVDGKQVFVAPGKFSQKVRVGKHTFYAEREGYNARITAPYVGPGEKFRIELKLYTAEELTRYRRRWDNTWFPYAVIGGGLLAGVGAATLQLSAQSDYDEFNKQVAACNTMSAGCPVTRTDITKMRDSGDSKRVAGLVGYGVAGAALATGALLVWLNRRQPYQISADELNAAETAAAPVAVTPIVSPELMGAQVQGHF